MERGKRTRTTGSILQGGCRDIRQQSTDNTRATGGGRSAVRGARNSGTRSSSSSEIELFLHDEPRGIYQQSSSIRTVRLCRARPRPRLNAAQASHRHIGSTTRLSELSSVRRPLLAVAYAPDLLAAKAGACQPKSHATDVLSKKIRMLSFSR
jgi:hypothetical protein